MGVSEWYDLQLNLYGKPVGVDDPLLQAAYAFEDISRRAGNLASRLRAQSDE